MQALGFEWDPRKARANQAKHGVTFGEASSAFGDPLSLTVPDSGEWAEEERVVLVGLSSARRLLVVIHTKRGERIRLISARLATKHEKRQYEES
jgi:uncharacterized DUF497 family protein